jgi:isochorismate pyruvate lyase
MSNDTPRELLLLRQQIDRVDRRILAALAERQDLVEQVITVKQKAGLPARIPERVEEVIAALKADAVAAGVSADLAEQLWRTIIDWFIAHEEKVLASDK